jgi:adenylosuccinate synthase
MNDIYLIQDLQYGDSGKGKMVDQLITDLLTKNNITKDRIVCIRYNGGENAGHSVFIDSKKYYCNSIPCGIFNGIDCYIASGCVFNPITFLKEVKRLNENGMYSKIYVSSLVSIITEEHIAKDKQTGVLIGTTGKGIGPCYSDNISRTGIRLGMLLDKTYEQMTDYRFTDDLINEIAQYVVSDNEINELFYLNKTIILESANAFMLDNKNGIYPYTTSGDCTFGGIFTGLNVSPLILYTHKWNIIFVIKSYTTRVGNGAFITELFDETGDILQTKGCEFGTTTGRKRRCGWLDLKQIKHALEKFIPKNFVNENINYCINLTKMDVLENIENVKYAINYEDNKEYPFNKFTIDEVKPIYNEILDFKNNTNEYINVIETYLNCKIRYLNTGADRNQLIYL